MPYSITSIKPFGYNAILVEWPKEMSESILWAILNYQNAIHSLNHNAIIETIQSINSLTIVYDTNRSSMSEMMDWLLSIESDDTVSTSKSKWEIPVCYDALFALDNDEMTQKLKIDWVELVELHTRPTYTVFSIGFLPGFLYLGGLHSKLHYPRKSQPRPQVLKGSIGIGETQTGVYPIDSPGGWNIIGKTPIPFFDISKPNPCFAQPGDQLVFYPVSYQEYKEIEAQINSESYQISKLLVHD